MSGTRAITEFDASHLTCRVAASVPDDALALRAPARPSPTTMKRANGRADPRRYAKVSRIAVLAAREALQDAGLDAETRTSA